MKFTIDKKKFVDVLSKVQVLVSEGYPGRFSDVLTKNVLIRATGTDISIHATDEETYFKGAYTAKVEKEGCIALNGRKLFKIIKDFPVDDINVKKVDNKNRIEIGNETILYNIVGSDPADFPQIENVEGVSFFEIPSGIFKKMMERMIIISSGLEDIKGVYFEIINIDKNKEVRAVSTDGARLSVVEHVYEENFVLPELSFFFIPNNGLKKMVKFMDFKGVVKIGFKDNKFIMKKDRENIIIELLEVDFPDWQSVLKLGFENTEYMSINRLHLLIMLKRMFILWPDKSVIFSFKKGKLSITPGIGKSGDFAKENISVGFEGKPIKVAFNPKFFIETLSTIECDTVLLSITNEERPCMISNNTGDYFTLIMPTKLTKKN